MVDVSWNQTKPILRHWEDKPQIDFLAEYWWFELRDIPQLAGWCTKEMIEITPAIFPLLEGKSSYSQMYFCYMKCKSLA